MPVAVNEQEPNVLISRTTPDITKAPEFEPGIWIRSCPICQAVLTKYQTLITVECRCGWHWLG
jgi:hypothetical protein